MADLTGVNDTLPVRIGGVSTSSGLPDNYADVTSAGQLLVKEATAGTVVAGTAALFSGLIGGQFNTTLPTLTTGQQAAIQVDSSGRLLIGSIASALPTGANTIGAVAQSGTWTVQPGNTANTTPWLVTVATALPAGANTIGSVNQGTSPWIVKDQSDGPVTPGTVATFSQLMGGQFNTTLPTLTTGQQSAIQLDSSGRILINLPTGASTAANQATEITLLGEIQTNTASAINDTITTGTITAAAGVVVVDAEGAYTISVSITGTWAGTLISECQLADNSWVAVPMYLVNGTLPYQPVFSTTTNMTGLITGGGYIGARIRCTAYTSGTVAVAFDASLAQQTTFSAQLGPWSLTNITGTISLPTGAATAALQTTGNTSLASIATPVGTVAPGTAGTGSYLKGLIYNTTLPTATNGQQLAAQSDASGRQLVTDTANIGSQYQALTVSTTAVLAIGGGTVLANRKALFITATTGTVYWGTNSSVTTTTGQPIQFGQSITFNFGPAITVYLIAAASTNVRVTEVS